MITQTLSAIPPAPNSGSPANFGALADPWAQAVNKLGNVELPAIIAQWNADVANVNVMAGLAARYTFDTATADADPGAGKLRLNQAVQNTATAVRMDTSDANGGDLTNWIATWDDSTSPLKGQLILRHATNITKWLILNLTALATPAGYRNLTVAVVASSAASPFANGDPLIVSFVKKGDKGDTGATGPESGYHTVKGLLGSTPGTNASVEFSADVICLRDAAGGCKTLYATGTKLCNLGSAGPVANGRDQAAAFAANSWVHLYFIWNGATLATLASLTEPDDFTGATLPAGYTHWVYATTVRWNSAGTATTAATISGSRVFHDVDTGVAPYRVIAAGNATAFTAVSCAAVVPPNALRGILHFLLTGNFSTVGSTSSHVRQTGSAATGGRMVAHCSIGTAPNAISSSNTMELDIRPSQSIDYRNAAALTSGGLYIDVIGYVIPNGDS